MFVDRILFEEKTARFGDKRAEIVSNEIRETTESVDIGHTSNWLARHCPGLLKSLVFNEKKKTIPLLFRVSIFSFIVLLPFLFRYTPFVHYRVTAINEFVSACTF